MTTATDAMRVQPVPLPSPSTSAIRFNQAVPLHPVYTTQAPPQFSFPVSAQSPMPYMPYIIPHPMYQQPWGAMYTDPNFNASVSYLDTQTICASFIIVVIDCTILYPCQRITICPPSAFYFYVPIFDIY